MHTIDIRTTQNVTIEYELAALWERMVALIIDLLIVLAFVFVLTPLIKVAIGNEGESNMSNVLLALLPIGLFIAYQLFSEILADGRSWGKKLMGLKVVRIDGAEPGLSDYLLRAVFYLIDFLFSLGILGSLLISSTSHRQRLGDMTANTTVIRTRHHIQFGLEDILKINTLDDYQPQFPAVRQFSEADMLLIKSIIARCTKYPNQAHQKALNELVQNLCTQLEIDTVSRDKIGFLKTLIRDYIVLTR
ncbi:MAG: RDD family protein [Saprospiraceae bacterium]